MQLALLLLASRPCALAPQFDRATDRQEAEGGSVAGHDSSDEQVTNTSDPGGHPCMSMPTSSAVWSMPGLCRSPKKGLQLPRLACRPPSFSASKPAPSSAADAAAVRTSEGCRRFPGISMVRLRSLSFIRSQPLWWKVLQHSSRVAHLSCVHTASSKCISKPWQTADCTRHHASRKAEGRGLLVQTDTGLLLVLQCQRTHVGSNMDPHKELFSVDMENRGISISMSMMPNPTCIAQGSKGQQWVDWAEAYALTVGNTPCLCISWGDSDLKVL